MRKIAGFAVVDVAVVVAVALGVTLIAMIASTELVGKKRTQNEAELEEFCSHERNKATTLCVNYAAQAPARQKREEDRRRREEDLRGGPSPYPR